MNYRTARLHNLLLRVYKVASKEEDATAYMDRKFTAEDLKSLYFRKSDFVLVDDFNPYFSTSEGRYLLTDKAKDTISQYVQQHNKYKDLDCKESEFVKHYEEAKQLLKDMLLNNSDNLHEKEKQMAPLAPPLHWKYQPEYEEYLLMNSGQIPENDLSRFYNHYHMLEDLYWYIKDPSKTKKVKSFLGDDNLNKEFDFVVYSKRWGHEDTYKVSRTIEGWNVEFHGTKIGNKRGNAIIYFMENDLINYSPYVGYLFEDIWNYADSNEVDVEKVAELMNKVAVWISETEKSTPILSLENR